MLLPSKERPVIFSQPKVSKPKKPKRITIPTPFIIFSKKSLESNSILTEPKIANTSMVPPIRRI